MTPESVTGAPPATVTFLIVGAGGALGAIARWLAEGGGQPAPGDDVWRTMVINVVGCLAIGVLSGWLSMRTADSKRAIDHQLRAFVGVGFLGGFTTFSAYAGDAVLLIGEGSWALALGYITGTVACCLVAVIIGSRAIRSLVRA